MRRVFFVCFKSVGSGERGFDRGNSGIRRRAIGTTPLRHVGTAAAALPAKRGNRQLDEFDCAQGGDLVVGHPDRDRGPPIVHRNQHRDTAADLLLQPVDRAAQFLGIEPVDHLREERGIADLLDRRPGSCAATRTAQRERLLCIGEFALDLLELLGKRGNATSVMGKDGKSLTLTAKRALVPGTYKVKWSAAGADTHRMGSEFSFTVK